MSAYRISQESGYNVGPIGCPFGRTTNKDQSRIRVRLEHFFQFLSPLLGSGFRVIAYISRIKAIIFSIEPLEKCNCFRVPRRVLKIKLFYFSKMISNIRVWKAAPKPILPSQYIVCPDFNLLVAAMTTSPHQSLHHVCDGLNLDWGGGLSWTM